MVVNLRISGEQSFPVSESDIRINFRNPCQIIAAANDTHFGALQVFFSSDGGVTWGQTKLPIISDLGDRWHSDPAVDWTSDGTAWAICLGVDILRLEVRSYKSADGGASWHFDATVSGTERAADKPMVWTDRNASSPFKDNIYVIWYEFDAVLVNRRTGPSGSWGTPIKVDGPETTGEGIGGDIKTNEFGDVFAFWPDTGSRKLLVSKSTDGGATFARPVTIAVTFASRQISIPANARRKALVYVSGGARRDAMNNLVYCVWTDLSGEPGCNSGSGPGTDVASTCKSRIWFSRSKDGGSTWEPARMINNQSSLSDQFFPWLAIDASTGLLMIVYYDTVADPARVKTDVWMQTSCDSGMTWSAAEKVTSAQTDETGSGADLGNQYGDYIGLSGQCGVFFPSWTDRRSGAREEIWTAPIAAPNALRLPEFIASTL